MGRIDKLMASVLLIGAIAAAPAANAWVLHTRQARIEAPQEPGIVAIGYATLASDAEPVSWSCDQPTVEVLVGTPYLHVPTGTFRRNLGLDLTPPTGQASASCELRDAAGTLSRIAIEFTGAGIVIEFPSAG
jgi:hypothetical protein